MTEHKPTISEIELTNLAAMEPLAYDQIRQETAKSHGVRVKTLDEQVEARRQKKSPSKEPNSADAFLADPVPWPSEVNGAEILNAVMTAIQRFMILSPTEADTVALWGQFTHVHEAADNSPTLCVKSPEKRCGKTTLLAIVATLVPRPLSAASVSPAALFRSIEAFRLTFLIDEADTFLRPENEEMRGLLNSGFSRASAFVVRCDGDPIEPRPFSTWCPKLIAVIGNLADTLEDRSIVIALRRRLAHEPIERFTREHHTEMHQLRSKMARWAKDNVSRLQGANPAMPDGLNDRAEDCWRPLIAIADAAGGDWPSRARNAALELSTGTQDEDKASVGVLLLTHIRTLFEINSAAEIQSSRLAQLLNANEEWPWGEWRSGKPITTHGIARLLGRFKIKPRHGRWANSYVRSDFEDAFTRYLPPAGSPSNASSTSSANDNLCNSINTLEPNDASSGSSAADPSVELEIGQKARKSATAELVEDRNGGGPGEGYFNGHARDAVDSDIEDRQ
jgi:putative DNA primase/helicase